MEENFLSRAQARQSEHQKIGGSGLLIWAVFASFILGAAISAYVAWNGGLDFLTPDDKGAEVVQAEHTPASPLALAEEPTPTPSASDAKAAAQAAEKAEKVAEQQGGLEARVVAMEQRLSQIDLKSQAAAGNAARAEGLLVAFSARRSIERGTPMGDIANQLKLRFGDANPNAVRTVIAAAERPVTLDKLIARLDGLAPGLSNTASEQVSWSWLKRELSGLFVVRRQSAPSPQPEKRLERARLFLESGRIQYAVQEVRNMPGADSPEAQQWLADADRYARAQEALEQLETAALFDENELRDGQGNPVKQPSPVGKQQAR